VSDLPSAEKSARDALKLLEAGAAEAALARVQSALAADPQSSFAHWIHAIILSDLGRDEEALTAYAASATGMWHNPAWHAGRVDCFIKLGRHKEALAASQDGLKLAPASSRLWCSNGAALAYVAQAKGSFYTPDPKLMKQAKRALMHAVELDPATYSARVQLGWIYLHEGNSHARRMIDEALAIRFGHPAIHHLAAAYSLETGALAEAQDHIDLVVSARPAARDTLDLVLRLRRARSSIIIRAFIWFNWNVLTSTKGKMLRLSLFIGFVFLVVPAMVDAGKTQGEFGAALLCMIVLPLVGLHLLHERQLKHAARAPALSKYF
jgi:tetratricopeptide (TPR) repeat protein